MVSYMPPKRQICRIGRRQQVPVTDRLLCRERSPQLVRRNRSHRQGKQLLLQHLRQVLLEVRLHHPQYPKYSNTHRNPA
jgi:hypothetical protein